jgi:hypothetical protein
MRHPSGTSIGAPENDPQNARVAKLLDLVTDRERRIQ